MTKPTQYRRSKTRNRDLSRLHIPNDAAHFLQGTRGPDAKQCNILASLTICSECLL